MPRLPFSSCLLAAILLGLACGCSRVDADQAAREAAAAMDQGEFARGARLARQALRAAPDRIDYGVLYGFALFGAEEHRAARDQLASIARAAPDSFLAQYFHGWVLWRLGAYGDAIAPLRKAVSLREGHEDYMPDVLVLLSRCCLKQNLAEGQRYLKGLRAYRSFAGEPEVYNSLGLLQVGQGQHEQALESFLDALRRDPGNPVVLQNLAVLHDTYLGDPKQAQYYYMESLYNRIARKDPTNQAAIRARLQQLARERRARG